MIRLLGVLAVAVIVAGLAAFSGPTASPTTAQTISCENFLIQSVAQTFLQAVREDPDQLDGPNDNGIACEELPCPCDLEPIAELIGDAPTPTPTATNTATNTPSPTQQPSNNNPGGGAQATSTPVPASATSASNTAGAATATSVAAAAAQAGAPPATVVPAASQTFITPPSTGSAGLER